MGSGPGKGVRESPAGGGLRGGCALTEWGQWPWVGWSSAGRSFLRMAGETMGKQEVTSKARG